MQSIQRDLSGGLWVGACGQHNPYRLGADGFGCELVGAWNCRTTRVGQASEKPRGVSDRGAQGDLVIEGGSRHPEGIGDGPRESAFADLARPLEHHHT